MKTSGTSASIVELERHTAEAAKQPNDDSSEGEVDEHERAVADPDAVRARHRLRGAHDAVDDPGLAADFGRDPARDQRHHRERPGKHDRAIEPARSRQPTAPEAHVEVDE